MELKSFSEKFSDIKIVKGKYFVDERGSLKKTLHGDSLEKLMPHVREVLCTTSVINTVRGMHFQESPYEISKFITCIKGEILDVFIDIRKESKTYGEYSTLRLTENDDLALFIPKGFAHGYSTITSTSTVVYLQSGDYMQSHDRSIHPESFGVDWKVDSVLLSEKDSQASTLEEFLNAN